MEIKNEQGKVLIDLLDNDFERVRYENTNFPFYIARDELSQYPDYTGVCHWHDDIELLFVTEGRMFYHVNGEVIPLSAGDGIFVNARQLHFGFHPKKRNAAFLCAVLPAELLCTNPFLLRKYIEPVTENRNLSYIKLNGRTAWAKRVFDAVTRMYEAKNEPLSELTVEAAFCELWKELYLHGKRSAQVPDQKSRFEIEAMKLMMTYIRTHYQEPLSVAELSAAGLVGKTTCAKIFKKYMNTSPNVYLNGYRLRRAAALLSESTLSMTEISGTCGFSGASYFAEQFKKTYGMSPTRYRQVNG